MSAIKALGLESFADDESGGPLSSNQRQTESAFGFKWHQEQSFDTEHPKDRKSVV